MYHNTPPLFQTLVEIDSLICLASRSGFPVAIIVAEMKLNRGWKATPIIQILNFGYGFIEERFYLQK
jgi:hypothetical protein